MCEPDMLMKTGLSVEVHQQRTVASYLDLVSRAPTVPWAPVLQGFKLAECVRCVRMYEEAGVVLADKIVGVGSVCRRQSTSEIPNIMKELHSFGLRLHAFGVKITGLPMMYPYIESADSMAWSLDARKSGQRFPGCKHKTCSNCYKYAELWYRNKILPLFKPNTSKDVLANKTP